MLESFYSVTGGKSRFQQVVTILAFSAKGHLDLTLSTLEDFGAATSKVQVSGIVGCLQDTDLKLTLIWSVIELSCAIQDADGSQSFQFTYKEELLGYMLDFMKEEPVDSLASPAHLRAMLAIKHLSKVKPSLDLDENRNILDDCLKCLLPLPAVQQMRKEVTPQLWRALGGNDFFTLHILRLLMSKIQHPTSTDRSSTEETATLGPLAEYRTMLSLCCPYLGLRRVQAALTFHVQGSEQAIENPELLEGLCQAAKRHYMSPWPEIWAAAIKFTGIIMEYATPGSTQWIDVAHLLSCRSEIQPLHFSSGAQKELRRARTDPSSCFGAQCLCSALRIT
ncbi:hypothetical protein Y1Q_0010488 [Alligator mississippiensis]|uniref:MROH2B-like HEAT-repeats domain-containing protein n=1 Tax=Alligator mississippiensis TaxID=8496 RepID=A0A151NDM2_ALLMI|nr:hypothetical protein Y1Q_0010488 [Alligator mississippiensis]